MKRRYPAHTIHITQNALFTEAFIKVEGRVVALTTMDKGSQKDSPQVHSFIRNYFHLSKPTPRMTRRRCN